MNNKIKQIYNMDTKLLTKSEHKVHEYILCNINCLEDKSIYDIQEDTFVSRASIDRYIKKIGFKGYKELKSYVYINSLNNNTIKSYEIELLVNYLVNNKGCEIAIIGYAMSNIMANYMKRRLNILGYHATACTFEDIVSGMDNFDILILISASGESASINNNNIVSRFNGDLTFAITRKNSSLSKKVNVSIDNNVEQVLNRIDRENMLSVVSVIEEIIYEI